MTDLTGRDFGRYHILEKLGEGGMAVVYKAYDTRLERTVAIKVILPGLQASEQFLRRFEIEAKSLARLTHPNIVNIIDYGEQDGLAYLVMEYIPGGTLKEKLGKPVPEIDSLHLLIPVARALEYTHRHGILHRDVKPGNILLTEDNEPMLSDFGIAKLLEVNLGSTLTGTGVGIGSPEYMAPEQGMGNAVDGRADIYALGVVFYEMLTGRRPYRADTPMAVILKHISEPLPSPRTLQPEISESVERVIIKAMAKDPDNRYATMGEFAVALEKIRSAQPTREIPPPMVLPLQPAPEPLPSSPPLQEPVISQPPVQELPAEASAAVSLSSPIVSSSLPVEEAATTVASPVPRQEVESPSPVPAVQAAEVEIPESLVKSATPPEDLSASAATVAAMSLHPPVAETDIQTDGAGNEKEGGGESGNEQSTTPIAAAPLTLFKQSWVRWTSSRYGRIGLWAVLGIVLLVILGVIGLSTLRQNKPTTGVPAVISNPQACIDLYFTSTRSGKKEIYRLDSNGKIYKVTNSPGPAGSWAPALLADSTVYFVSDRTGKQDIWRLNTDGRLARVTNNPKDSYFPAVMLDGTVYFTSYRDGKQEIYGIDDNGKTYRVTTTAGDKESWLAQPALNGDIFFTSNRTGKREVFRLDGSGKTYQITNTPKGESFLPAPTFAGDVVFTSNRSGKQEIYRLDANGKTYQVTNTPGAGESFAPIPAPNGDLYFVSTRSGKQEIYRLDVNGKTYQVTNTQGGESWTPAPLRVMCPPPAK